MIVMNYDRRCEEIGTTGESLSDRGKVNVTEVQNSKMFAHKLRTICAHWIHPMCRNLMIHLG